MCDKSNFDMIFRIFSCRFYVKLDPFERYENKIQTLHI